MEDGKFNLVNAFELYCNSLDENCPVILLNVLELLKEQQKTIEKLEEANAYLENEMLNNQ